MATHPLITSQAGFEGYLWQAGRIQSKHNHEMWVEMDTLTECQRCLAGQGCGAGVYSRLFAKRGAKLKLEAHDGLDVGQRVQVGVAPKALLKASLWLYAWPLGLFLVTVMGLSPLWSRGQYWGGDWAVLVLALLVAGLGLKAIGDLRCRALNPIVLPLSCHRAIQTSDPSDNT